MITFCCPTTRGPNDSMRTLLDTARSAGHPVEMLGESPIDRCRGMLASRALSYGTDWLAWVDDDQVGTIDQMLGLVATAEAIGADLMTGVYVCRHLAAEGKIAFNFSPEVGGEFTLGVDGGPYPIISCGFGFLVVHRSVFERIVAEPCNYGKAWFLPLVNVGNHLGEDRSFGVRAKAAGCQLYVDTRVLVGHEGKAVYHPGVMLGGIK